MTSQGQERTLEANGARVTGLNHVNLRSPDVAATGQFYCDLLGMTMREPETSMETGQSRWLCDANGVAILHLRHMDVTREDGGAVDQVALNCTGMTAILDRMRSRGIPFGRNDGLVPGMTQIFVAAPQNVRLELIFMNE